jgi:hypothetical protein
MTYHTCLQILGSIFGALIYTSLIPSLHIGSGAGSPGCFAPGNGTTAGGVFGWETMMTFLLVMTVYAAAVAKPGHGNTAPLAIGLSLYAAAISGTKLLQHCCSNSRSGSHSTKFSRIEYYAREDNQHVLPGVLFARRWTVHRCKLEPCTYHWPSRGVHLQCRHLILVGDARCVLLLVSVVLVATASSPVLCPACTICRYIFSEFFGAACAAGLSIFLYGRNPGVRVRGQGL